MRWVVHIIIAIVLSSCVDEVPDATLVIAEADVGQDTVVKHAKPSDTMHLAQRIEVVTWNWSPYWGICYWGITELHGTTSVETPPIQIGHIAVPDSVGVMSLDSTTYRDSITQNPGDYRLVWLLDDTLIRNGAYHWTHTLWNSGDIPITNISIKPLGACATASITDTILFPGDTAELIYTVKCPVDYMAYDFELSYTTKWCLGEDHRVFDVHKHERYFMKYKQPSIQY